MKYDAGLPSNYVTLTLRILKTDQLVEKAKGVTETKKTHSGSKVISQTYFSF
jgi:hypothetical protein